MGVRRGAAVVMVEKTPLTPLSGPKPPAHQ